MLTRGTELPLNESSLIATLLHFFNDSTTVGILNLYPADFYKDNDSRFSAILRDFIFVCPSRFDVRLAVLSFSCVLR
jgi:hypothetical protein